MSASNNSISLQDLSARLADGTAQQFWNVLTDEYFTGEMIPGSRRVPLDHIGRELAITPLPKHTSIVVYCSGPTCPQSRAAADKLRTLGFTDVQAYEGGLFDWKNSGRALDAVLVAS